jgi:hypothetical protein
MIQSQHNDPVQRICDFYCSDDDPNKMQSNIAELTNQYKVVVRDALIVLTNPAAPQHLVYVMSDEIHYELRDLLGRVDLHKLESVEAFLPLLLTFDELGLLTPTETH